MLTARSVAVAFSALLALATSVASLNYECVNCYYYGDCSRAYNGEEGKFCGNYVDSGWTTQWCCCASDATCGYSSYECSCIGPETPSPSPTPSPTPTESSGSARSSSSGSSRSGLSSEAKVGIRVDSRLVHVLREVQVSDAVANNVEQQDVDVHTHWAAAASATSTRCWRSARASASRRRDDIRRPFQDLPRTKVTATTAQPAALVVRLVNQPPRRHDPR